MKVRFLKVGETVPIGYLFCLNARGLGHSLPLVPTWRAGDGSFDLKKVDQSVYGYFGVVEKEQDVQMELFDGI